MYFELADHIYLAQFRDEIVILDVKRDKYTICNNQFSELLKKLIEDHQENRKFKNVNYSENIQELIDANIIKIINTPSPFYIDRKLTSKGVAHIDWRLPLENNEMSLTIPVLKALIILSKVNFYMKFKGFYSSIKLIKNSYNRKLNYIIPKKQELNNLADVVNQACLIYPVRTKCLEWSMTFVLLALQQRWKCNLEIGIQNYPFSTHAWVECDDKALFDSQDLREGLSIILNEPFRKLKV